MIGKRRWWISLFLCFACLCGVIYAAATDLENCGEKKENIIEYHDGTFAEIMGTAETVKGNGSTVIGSKTYIYHDLSGEILFTYTVKAAFEFDGETVQPTGCCTTFYLSDGWEKKQDQFEEGRGTAIFSDGKKQKKIRLTVSCSPVGVIS